MGNQIIKIGDYCDIIKGNIGIKKAIPGEYPLVVTAEDRLSHNEYQFDTTAVIIPLVSSTGHGHASIKRLHYQEGKFALGTILCAVIVKDTTIINPRFLYIYLSYFKDHLLVPLMKGAANVTLSIKRIKDVEIILPSLERQLEIIELEQNNELLEELNFEIENQKELTTQLKQSILQEAIQGKLTEDWRKQNPDVEPASELLKRIKEQKAQLVKEKKIRKEKALPPITEDEIPFELPEGWVWSILDEIALFKNGKAHEQFVDSNGEYILINSKFVSTDGAVKKHTGELMMPMFKDEIAIVMSDVPNGRALSRCFLIDENDKYSLNQRIGGIVGLKGIYPKYLIAVLDRNPHYLSFNDGKKQTNLKKDHILSCPIPLPPYDEQISIVEKVEVLFDKTRALESEITQSEQYAQILMQAVLKEAFESKKEIVNA